MNHEPDWERRLADALKSVARRPDVKSFVEQTPWLYQLLRRAARQYVAGEERRDGLDAAGKLADMGYRTSWNTSAKIRWIGRYARRLPKS
ncbi:hypothetical protein VQ056_06940 [Paenibacillus sp. JTLBN-2024]